MASIYSSIYSFTTYIVVEPCKIIAQVVDFRKKIMLPIWYPLKLKIPSKTKLSSYQLCFLAKIKNFNITKVVDFNAAKFTEFVGN